MTKVLCYFTVLNIIFVADFIDARRFLVSLPLVFSSSEQVCISYHGNFNSSEQVSIKVKETSTDKILFESHTNVEGPYHCHTVTLPLIAPKKELTTFQISFSSSPEIFRKHVYFRPETPVTFISTNKPSYGPGELVKFRIFSVKPVNFTADYEKVKKVWVENPQGISVMQWTDKNALKGFIDLSFYLTKDPMIGVWKIIVLHHDRREAREFSVNHFDLPLFDVDMVVEKRVESSTPTNISVCARYSFGKPLVGKVMLTTYVKCAFEYYCAEHPTPSYLNMSLGPDGCAISSVIAAIDEKSTMWHFLQINATVIDSASGQSKTISRKVKVIPFGFYKAITGSFGSLNSRFKVGLPYFGKLILTEKGKPTTKNISVTICAQLDEEKICKLSKVTNGFIEFVKPQISQINNRSYETVKFKAEWYGENGLKSEKSIFPQPWFSCSFNFLQIQDNFLQKPLKCGQVATVKVLHNVPLDNTSPFYVIIKSRGSIKLFQDVSTMPSFISGLFSFDTSNKTVFLRDTNDTIATPYFSFNFDVPPETSPLISLLIYTVRRDGEIIADSVSLAMEPCYSFNVSVDWHRNIAEPGSKIALRITAPPQSICSISASDIRGEMNNSFVQSKFDIFTELNRRHAKTRSVHGSPQHNRCAFDTKGAADSDLPVTYSYFHDSLEAFEHVGLAAITDLTLMSRPCRLQEPVQPRGPRPLASFDVENEEMPNDVETVKDGLSDDQYSTRTFFPDTWIWDIVSMGNDNSTFLETNLPDSVTTWKTHMTCISNANGVSVATPTSLKGFKPFFLDFKIPSVIRRNELVHVPVTVFNYFNSTIPVMISISPSDQLHVKLNLEHNICLTSNGQANHVFHLLAVKMGIANVSIKAQVNPFSDNDCGSVVEETIVDHVIKPTMVIAEGRPIEQVRSAILCGNDSVIEKGYNPSSASWNLILSSTDFVEKSLKNEVRISGDILGPALMKTNKWIQKPIGCGEQNMFNLATNILMKQYINLNQNVYDIGSYVSEIESNIKLGYQQQLSFRHSDGSYSAFGPDSSNSSIWLTAFVVRYFTALKEHNFVDDSALEESIEWLLQQQLENGCFPLIGSVYHWTDERQRAEAESPKALTAFVLSSILLSTASVPQSVVKNAAFCLESINASDDYADLMMTYVNSLMELHRDANLRMKALLLSAEKTYNYLWWESPDGRKESSIEMTSYGIKSMLKLGGTKYLTAASDAVRWLIQYQNGNGGFISTQDTILALEAIIAYSQALPPLTGQLQIVVQHSGINQSYIITNDNKFLQQDDLPNFLTNIQFEAFGKGCALVQTVTKYNARRGKQGQTLKLHLRTEPLSSSEDNLRRVEVCVRTKGHLNSTGMAIVEINLPTGYFADRSSLYKITATQNVVKMWEEFDDHVNFYMEHVNQQKVCFHFIIEREICVDSPAYIIAKVYDYYNAVHVTSLRYLIQQICNDTIVLDSWLNTPSKDLDFRRRFRRDIVSDGNKTAGNNSVFDNSLEDPYDLEAPKQIGGRFEIFALPPPTTKGRRKCPQCLSKVPDIFPKLYCSTRLAILARFRGEHLMDFLRDLSPPRASTNLRRSVSYTMNQECDCDFTKTDGFVGFILVTPPRTFKVRSVHIIHLDDSFAIIPWTMVSQYSKTLFESKDKCLDELTAV